MAPQRGCLKPEICLTAQLVMAVRRMALLGLLQLSKAHRPTVPGREVIVHEIRRLASVEIKAAKRARRKREAS